MKEKFKHTTALFKGFVLFTFVLVSMILILVGSNAYANISGTMDNNAVLRTASGYLTNKERELGSSLRIEEDVLVFETEIEGEKFSSYIYYDEGFLKEDFLPEDYEFQRGGGELITALDDFSLDKQAEGVRVLMRQGENTIEKFLREG